MEKIVFFPCTNMEEQMTTFKLMDVALLKSKCNDTPPHTTRFLGNLHDAS